MCSTHAWRCYAVRSQAAVHAEEQNAAAIHIQRVIRGKAGRAEAGEVRSQAAVHAEEQNARGLGRNGAANMASPPPTPSTDTTQCLGSDKIPLADKRTGYHYIDELPKGKPGSKCANCKHHHNKPKGCKTDCPDCSTHLYKGKVFLCARCCKGWHSKEAIQTP